MADGCAAHTQRNTSADAPQQTLYALLTAEVLSQLLGREVARVSYRPIGEGNGFLGSIHAAKVTYSNGESEEIAVKQPPPLCSAEASEFVSGTGIHEHEARFYQCVAPLLADVSPGPIPRYRFFHDNVLGMQLCEGSLMSFAHGLDRVHMECALRAVARFHSATVAVTASGRPPPPPPDALSWAAKQSAPLESLFTPDMFRKYWETFEQAAGHALDANSRAVCEAVCARASDHWDVNRARTRFAHVRAMCNNDLWSNNVLFARAHEVDSASPGELRCTLLDWQFAHWNDPLRDVVFLLFSSGRSELIQTHFADLLKVYTSALSGAAPEPTKTMVAAISAAQWAQMAQEAAAVPLLQFIVSHSAFFKVEDGGGIERERNEEVFRRLALLCSHCAS